MKSDKPLPFNASVGRLLLLILFIGGAFAFLTHELFEIQIIGGQAAYDTLTYRQVRHISTPAERGNIYDRFGRPLAVNIPAHSVLIDPSVVFASNDELNVSMLYLVRLLADNGEDQITALPLTESYPFEFTFTDQGARGRFFREATFAEDNLGGQPLNAADFMDIATAFFGIDVLMETYDLSPTELRGLISLRMDLFHRRFTRFIPVTIAMGVGAHTITAIEEDAHKFRSAFISTEFLRYYPGGRYTSHIVGMIGPITDQHDADDLLERGYLLSDLLGHTGIELAFEAELRGARGTESIYVSNLGRRLATVENSQVDSVNGSDIFLTIDKELQMTAYYILKAQLVETIIFRLNNHHNEGPNNHVPNLTVPRLLASLVRTSPTIDPRLMFEAEEGTLSHLLVSHLTQAAEALELELNPATLAGRLEINRLLSDEILHGRITATQVLLLMYDQGILVGDDTFRQSMATANPLSLVTTLLRDGQITPQMTGVDPSTGSLVIVDVHTGEVLASVNYPSFDTNQLVNHLNVDYFLHINNDFTTPQSNRAFAERRAPGSTFKMITGIAGIETGVITPTTRIQDRTVFRLPHLDDEVWSWSPNASLGVLNNAQAVARSSNYFFLDVAYRLGAGNSRDSAAILNRYMSAFGLNAPTGIEIGEQLPQMSSPELHDLLITDRPWTNGDLVRTGIGQGLNNYTPATMARLTAGIATQGNMVDLRLLYRIVGPDAITYAETVPFDMGLTISQAAWDSTHEGMRQVTEWSGGTAFNIFSGFPMSVGAKTGTAQEVRNRPPHTTFNVFAPLDNPQIAMYVILPFGAAGPSPSAQVAREVMRTYFRLDDAPAPFNQYANILLP